MSTNKSQTLKLHLWEPEDNFLRTEFNENFAAIDAAVRAVREIAEMAYSPEQKPYVTGSYTGNGGKLEINLGFKPRFVITVSMRSHYASGQPNSWTHYFAMSGGNLQGEQLMLTSNGFSVSGTNWPNTCDSGRIYDYIAFH